MNRPIFRVLLVALSLTGCDAASEVAPVGVSETPYVSPPGSVECFGAIPTSDTRFPVIRQAFTHPFDGENPVPWCATDGRGNPKPFYSGWRADHVEVSDGALRLKLSDSAVAGKPYGGGEFLTHFSHHYGRYSARLKPARGSGVVTGLFTYTGPEAGNPHDEIDIEFLGNKPTQLQTNYFTHDVGGHEKLIALGFDATADYHEYAFEWRADSIRWFVDGKQVHEETGARGPLPQAPGRILVNLWAAVGADTWVGPFTYPGQPYEASVDSLAFTPF